MKRAIWMLASLLFMTACAAPAAPASAPIAEPAALASGMNTEPTAPVSDTAAYYIEITPPATGVDRLEFTIVNATGSSAEILLIPTLEVMNEEGAWEVVPMDNRFGLCGTPDPLPEGEKDWSVEMNCLWGNLYKGQYRLSYTVTDKDGQTHIAAGEFSLTYDAVLIPR